VADPRRRRSALAALYREGRFGAPGETRLVIAERRPLTMVQVAAWSDTEAEVRTTLADGFGIALPSEPNTGVCPAETAALWLGAQRWLIVRADRTGADLFAELVRACAETAAITEVSHARTCLRLAGSAGRDVLAKGTGIDLHPRAFASGACAQTVLGHVGALLHAAAEDVIDLYVARSYAQHAWEWLIDAAAEFGYAVEAARP
jgi:sarcosine oxidase subunit gamma